MVYHSWTSDICYDIKWYISWYLSSMTLEKERALAQVKATFYLPLKDNDGRDLAGSIAEVEDRCFVAFGAWTLVGFFKGVWRMASGQRAVDTSAVYSIVLEENRLPELEMILREFKAQTSQESIYLEIEHHVELRLL